MNIGPKYQRGYAVLPYLASFFTAGASAGGAAAGGAAAGAAAAGTAAGVGTGLAAAGVAGGAFYSTALALGASKLLAPKPPSIGGMAPPTIDQAKQAQQAADRLRLRKGVLANVYGGAGATGAPSVGTAKLLGQ